MNEKRLAIIGGSGYIGAILSAKALAQGYYVTVYDIGLYQAPHPIIGFIEDAKFSMKAMGLGDLHKEECGILAHDVIIDLAALVGDPISKKYPKESEQINEVDTINLINHLISSCYQGRFIFMSTCSNYGLALSGGFVDEESELNPLSIYARNKVKIEKHLLNGSSGLDFTILRCATAFGMSPRMRFDLTVSEFCLQFYHNGKFEVWDQDTYRPYCHVRDISTALLMVSESKKKLVSNQVFNVGTTENNHTKREIVDLISKYLPDIDAIYVDGGGDKRDYRVSFSKIQDVLGFQCEYTVQQGISELIHALNLGCFQDAFVNMNNYGNYHIPMFD